ncbi:unnamed protein product [Somion occarium]|uniref:Uncharacterized protein n=1 Tax=Somion occarium TaxID=3059160 RepID=A0ABP1D8D4_9APHY
MPKADSSKHSKSKPEGKHPTQSDRHGSYSVDEDYGSYEDFMHSYGLKPWDADDIEEASQIAKVIEENTWKREAKGGSKPSSSRNPPYQVPSDSSSSRFPAEKSSASTSQKQPAVPNPLSEQDIPLHTDAGFSSYDSFGGYENFMHSYGLKPWEDDDIEEGQAIAEVLEKDHSGSSKSGSGLGQENSGVAILESPSGPRLTPISEGKGDQGDLDDADYDSDDQSGHPLYDSFGGYENFMHSYGLKPWDSDDIDEGEAIARVLEDHGHPSKESD